jgi:hypothetical protein
LNVVESKRGLTQKHTREDQRREAEIVTLMPSGGQAFILSFAPISPLI